MSMRQFILFLLVMISFNAFAVTYPQAEFDEFMNDSYVQQSSKEFVREFFIEKDPFSYINKILMEGKNNNPILLEYKLYHLLDEISYHVKQGFLQEFVTQMKTYTSKVFKIHDEGRVPVEIYNINAKAQGIENIWMADDAFREYRVAFERDSVGTLLKLKSELSSLKQPEWFGLKKSIQTISQGDIHLITGYLLGGRENLIGLDKFVSRYTLSIQDEELTEFALKHLDKSSSEYLLRNLKINFNQSFVKRQLLNMIEYKKNESFTISLLAEYLNDEEIEKSLVSLLAKDRYSQQAAMVLARTTNVQVIQDIESMFFKNDSEKIKKQVVFILKMNQLESARVVLERISRGLENGLQTNKWLQSFKEERK